jgi:tetratricopeptide (TPR) repeat protein
VYIPDPNQPAGTRPDLKGQKPHANAVLQTVLTRNAPRFLTWPGQGGGDNPIETAGQRWGGAIAVPMEADELGIELESIKDGISDTLIMGDRDMDRLAVDLGRPIPATSFGMSVPMLGARFKAEGRRALKDLAKQQSRLTDDVAFDFAMPKDRKRLESLARQQQRWGPATRGFVDGAETGLALRFEDATRMPDQAAALDRFMTLPMGNRTKFREALGEGTVRDAEFYSQLATHARWNDLGVVEIDGDGPAMEFEKRLKVIGSLHRQYFAVGQNEAGLGGRGERHLNLQIDDLKQQLKEGRRDKNKDDGWARLSDAEGTAGYFASLVRAPQYYGRPSFNGNSRVFTDLVAYAPGMSSSSADVRAVLEAEAAPRFGNRRGSIDPAARKLIDRARTGEWKAIHLPAGDGKTIAFVHDGAGRYAYERRVAFGLLERVVCDGTHLWHLYPELGIGAERVVSRFHRAPLLDLVPDLVPPTDDLAYGADVKWVDAKTVALVPLRPAKTDDNVAEAWLEIHMVFDGARLAERRWVLQPDKELLAREVYESGTTKLVNVDGKELDSTKQDVRPAQAPDLKPDLSKLVVLSLPLRSREHVYRQLEMEPGWNLHHDRNACFEYLPDVDAMKLLACEFAANNGSNVADVWYTCFGNKGDHRSGFFTLMAAAGQGPRGYWAFNQKFEKDATDPLVRYLWQLYDPDIHDWQARFGFGPGYPSADTFLGRLTAFRQVFDRWNGGFIGDQFWGQRDGERQRALEFAVHNPDNVLGWCALGMVQDRCTSAAAYKAVADVWGVLAEKSGLKYPARYEQARCLGNSSDHYAVAQQKYQALFQDALKEGVLPPLDSSFRSVLENGEQGTWAKLMRETAAKCAEKKARPVIVTLAWQCYQLGDTAMSDTLLDQAVKDVPAEEKLFTHVAAIHFLTATGRHDRADQLIRDLLADANLAKSASLWRLAVQTADNRRDPVRAAECLEHALDIEYARLPELFDVQPIRNDYGRLLSHYEWLADASTSLKVSPPKDLVARVVKAADRWRQLDPEAQDVCNRVATILRKAGGDGTAELAWDYVTTPLAVKPNEAGPWTSLASSLRQEGNWRLADKCYAMAFAAEPTNAQLLWDRAQHLQNQGQIAESRALLKQLAESEWQPRFNGLKAQARQAVEGR